MSGTSTRVIGLMSGTSADGIDAALVRFEPAPGSGAGTMEWELEAFVSLPYSSERRDAILAAIEDGSAARLCTLHAELGEWLGEACERVCADAGIATTEVDAVGSHGHTVWHIPPGASSSHPGEEGVRGASLQLGDPARIAERTGVDVVSDFRARDLAAGGHGAPLVPWADRLLFRSDTQRRALQNIGGMANVTWLSTSADEPPLAFDTGPGMALIDAAVEAATAGVERFDRDGGRAARGRVDEALLERLLSDPFFAEEPPRSTGREHFGRPFVGALVDELEPASEAEWDALVATLTALTARAIGVAYERWVLPRGVDEVFVTGGGAHNRTLVDWIAEVVPTVPIRSGADLGLDPDAREAVAFAALAWAHLNGVPGNVPESTRASGPRILGSFTPGGDR